MVPIAESTATGLRIVKVEPLTTARALRGPFDYRLPGDWPEIGVGAVLKIPFAHRKVLGVVTGTATESELPGERLAEPVEVVGPGIPPELADLGLWLAEQYCSTPARGLSLVLPPGTGTTGARITPRLVPWAAITDRGREALGSGERLGPVQRAVLQYLAGVGEADMASIRAATGADSSSLRRLEARGHVEMRKERRLRRPREGAGPGPAPSRAPELNDDQAAAVGEISEGLAREEGDPVQLLLHGVTGSGKTEVYLAAVERALAAGRGAIVLVPEIALTPQAVARFRARLGEGIAVIHSALSEGERYDEWSRLRSGEARVCVGPRSAVFAPVHDLGLIVIDEEHDPSYKQDRDPRYDAREVAERRLQGRGGVLVAGSATPRPETWTSMRRISLPNRVDGRSLPPVELVDMRRTDPRSGPLHPRTMRALDEVYSRGEKAIVLINRRGFAPWLTCRSCGHHWSCPNCDVSLITHREVGLLICHHCDHREHLPRSCGECGSTTLARSGAGSEQIADILAERLAPMPVLRMDADTVGRGGHGELLERFAAYDSAVLVGTQMVAKGHDFPEVTLAVVLDADASLRIPDFRAEERTFALVTQLAGRSGRGGAGGRVMVQTLAPSASSIRHAAEHDAEGFLAAELERRQVLRYPPYSHLIGIILAATDRQRLVNVAAEMRGRLAAALPADADLLGPAPMFRTRNRFRRRFMIKAPERMPAVAAVRQVVETLAEARAFTQVQVSVDVAPQ